MIAISRTKQSCSCANKIYARSPAKAMNDLAKQNSALISLMLQAGQIHDNHDEWHRNGTRSD